MHRESGDQKRRPSRATAPALAAKAGTVRLLLATIAALAAVALAPAASTAEEAYPSRVVKLVVPSSAGSFTDLLARVLATKLSAGWGQSVVVENIAGGGLNIGAEHVARSAPDGYTLMLAPPPPVSVNEFLYAGLKYRPSDFVPITMVGQIPNVLIVRTSLPPTTLQQFVAHAKAAPGKLTYGSQGLGSTAYLTARLFEATTGTRMTNVPYRGELPILNDIVAGHLDAFFGTLSSAMPLHRSQKIRILAVGSRQRHPAAPEIPTIAESGLPGFQSTAWYVLVAPPGTPPAIVRTINEAVVAAMKAPDVDARLRGMLLEPLPGSPADAAAFVAAETRLWSQVIRDAGVPRQ